MSASASTPDDAQFGVTPAGKLGMFIFLVSDAFSFAALLIAYGALRARDLHWGASEPGFSVALAGALTALLVFSSFTADRALWAARAGKSGAAWVAATIALGAAFLAIQAYEWSSLSGEGLAFADSARASTFYAVTGFHGLHVLAGVLLWVSALGAGKDAGRLEVLALFWHFVDLVWVGVFTCVYLLDVAHGALRPVAAVGALAAALAQLWFFMHLGQERRALKMTVLVPLVFPLLYAGSLIFEAAWRAR